MSNKGHEPEVIERARAKVPEDLRVTPRTTPVVSFGRPYNAKVATLGINPSDKEFTTKNGDLLTHNEKRLVDRELLDIADGDNRELSPEEAIKVIEGSYSYFDKPKTVYKKWFGWMESYAVNPSGASYFDGSACHLDLVQWATSPVWGQIEPKQVQRELIDADAEFLRFQLTQYNIPLLLLNGREVINQFKELKLTELVPVRDVPMRPSSRGCQFFMGKFQETKVFAWTNNIPSRTPQPNRESIRDWLRDQTSK